MSGVLDAISRPAWAAALSRERSEFRAENAESSAPVEFSGHSDGGTKYAAAAPWPPASRRSEMALSRQVPATLDAPLEIVMMVERIGQGDQAAR